MLLVRIYVHLIKHEAGTICYHHAEPRKCLHITCNSTYFLKAFWPVAHLFLKPGLHEPQLQVEWSVTFLYSLVVERRC